MLGLPSDALLTEEASGLRREGPDPRPVIDVSDHLAAASKTDETSLHSGNAAWRATPLTRRRTRSQPGARSPTGWRLVRQWQPMTTWQTYQHVVTGLQTDAADRIATLIISANSVSWPSR